jgi:hypothetical protein
MSRRAQIERGRVGVYLVTIRLPGTTVRVATEEASVPYATGDGPLSYFGGAQIEDFAEEVDYLATDAIGSAAQVRVSATMPPHIDPAVLELQGYLFSASTAEVALWWPDEDYTARRILLTGRVQLAELGRANEPLSFTIESIPINANSDSVGDAERDIEAEYDTRIMPTSLEGQQFPLIIGPCYRIPGYKVGSSGSADELVLAGHHFHDTTTVVIVYGDGAALAPAHDTPVNTVTDAGEPVCVLQDTVGLHDYFSGSALAFTFDAVAGGVRAVEGDRPVQDLADALHWLLVRSGAAVDWVRMRPALDRLRGWRGGVYVDEETNALDIIEERLLPYLPLVKMQSNDGLWFAYIDLDNLRPEVDLTAPTHLLGTVGGLKIEGTTPYNRFILNYFYDHFYQRYMKTVTVDDTNNALCFWSKEVYGVSVAPTLNWSCTWDDATARRALVSIANRRALPASYLDYYYDPGACPELRAGQIVRLTDPDYGLTSRYGYVSQVGLSTDPPTCRIKLFPRSPVRDGRI